VSVLVITYSEDNVSVRDVIERLRAEGEHVFRLDTDLVPEGVRMASCSSPAGLPTTLESEDDRVELADVTAVWYRRNRIGRELPVEMTGQIRETAIREARTALFGAIDALACFQLDRYWAVQRASQKPLQLALAQQLGLPTPPTLITNDPERVRRFAAEHGPLVFKPVSDIAIGDNYPVERVWTNRLGADELADLAGLELSPMIFQKEIPKRLELRATVIDRRVHCAAVDPSVVGADDDWRKQGDALLDRWSVFALPASTSDNLLRLMDRLELRYGAADFILTPAGELIFLELNPVGEFCWLDKLTALPLGDELASLLLRHARGR